MFYLIDAHLHLCDIPQVEKEIEFFFSKYDKIRQYSICTSSHSLQDWQNNCDIINKIRQKYDNDKIKICHSFGVHPQNPDKNILYDLETLLKYDKTSENMTTKYDTSEIKYDNSIENMTKYDKVFAIGECGFDLFTDEYKSSFVEQKEIWNTQLELAIKYDKPIIVHCRKGMCHIFESIEKLKKITSVIFHSFPGSVTEANSLRKKGVNAFFSFGKPILNGNKNAMDCVKNLPLEWLLLETDSPYQTLKGEVFTSPTDILKVYEQVFNLRKENSEIIASKIYENFDKSIITNKIFPIL